MQFRIFAKKIARSELDFSRLEKNYRIDSLALHKLNLGKILEFYRQIQVKYTFESKKGKTWFQNELRIFIWVVFNYSNFLNKRPTELSQEEWETVAQYFHKESLTCKYFFLCIEKNRKSEWTEDQDNFVMDHINKPSFTNEWTEIGKELFVHSSGAKFKKPKQIRERWNNYLNPSVSKDKWSVEEDLVLFRIASKEGRKWALISKVLKSRSQHSVKNRYTNLFKKFKSYQSNNVRYRRSELENQFIKYSLKKLEEQKIKNETQQNIEPKKNCEKQQSKGGIDEQKPFLPTSTHLALNDNNQNCRSSKRNSNCYMENNEQWQFLNDQRIFHDDSQQQMLNGKIVPPSGDSKSLTKDKFVQSSFENSPQLEFIKSPIYFGQKEDDFMSTENLMKSFQPSYHHYLF